GERGKVRPDEAVSDTGELVEIDILAERHAARVNGEDLAPPGLVGYADDDLAVEAPRPAQRLIERIDPIGGADHHHVLPRLEPVHQGQQLRHDAPLDLAGDL